MIRKILKSKRAEGYLDVVIGVVALVMFIVIALNIFTFVTLKTTIDRIADDLIEVATFSGSFGDGFNAKVDQLKAKYFDFEVETYVEKYYNAEHKRVQIGDDMGFTIRVNASVAGISITLPIDVTASRVGQSEQYWKPATGIYETPPIEDDSWKPLFVLNTKSYKFHHPECSSLKSMAAANRLEMRATATELIALGYDSCGICDPHDCKSSSVTNYNKDEHWGQCDICGKTGTAVKHTFVYDVEFLYYHCEYCNAIQTDTGTIRCHGGTPLTAETHSMSCDCDHVRPTLTVSNLSTRKGRPTSLDGDIYRVEGTATDFKGSVVKVTVNGMNTVLDTNGNWYYDLDCSVISNSEIIIVATDNEDMTETIVCYVRTKTTNEQIKAGLYETGTTSLIKSWEDLIADGTITVTDGTIAVSKKNAIVGDLVLPSDGSVTSIDIEAFRNCSYLTSITIPDGVTSIGGRTFQKCTSLTSIDIPDSVTSINYNAFEDCTSLTSVTIPGSVTGIGSNAFSGCTGLTSVTIPDSVTTIGDGAFKNCTSLTSVTIPDSVTTIDKMAFFRCASLTEITIPASVTRIGSNAFLECTLLSSASFVDTSNWYKTIYSSYTGGVRIDVSNVSNAATIISTSTSYYFYKP